MSSSIHFKLIPFLLLTCCLVATIYCNRQKIVYKMREWYLKVRRCFGRSVNLNDSFVSDLESGFSSHNFDIISQNGDDSRSGLDENSKTEIRRIMEEDNLSFDEARLQYTERKFGQHGIAPDGTPMDPKAVRFS